MNELRFTIYGTPQQMGSKKAFARKGKNGKAFARMIEANDESLRPWQDSVKAAAMAARPEAFEIWRGPIGIVTLFHFQRPQSHYGKRGLLPSAPIAHAQTPDDDKLERGLRDALSGVIYLDDRLITDGTTSSRWTEQDPRADVFVAEVGDGGWVWLLKILNEIQDEQEIGRALDLAEFPR